MRFEDSVTYLLSKMAVAHRNLLEREMSEVGLHSGQVFVLFELWEKDGQRQIDLANRLGISPPTVNKILGGLIGADLATRGRMEDDARSSRIFLTPEGRDLRHDVETRWDEIEEITTAGLTDTESLMLKQLIAKMLNFDGGADQ